MKLDALVIAHARSHPAEVAALLRQQNVEDAVAFCVALPDTAAAPLVAALSGTLAQRVLTTVEPPRVAGWLASASFDEAVGLLSRVQPAQRSELIEAIRSGRRRQELSRRFVYAEGTLGAIASRDVITVPVGATLRDVALELHEQDIKQAAEPPIYLLGAGGQLHGSLDLYRALESEDLSLPVERCMVTVEALPADMPLDAALASRRWDADLVLPVVDRNRVLLGAVTLQRIREASHSDRSRGQDFDAVADLARRFIEVLAGLAETAVGGRTKR